MVLPRKQFDGWSLLVIIVTLVLFAVALVVKGLPHDVLLEAAVFLVSVKLIMMSFKNGVQTEQLEAKLDEIQSALRRLECIQSNAVGTLSTATTK